MDIAEEIVTTAYQSLGYFVINGTRVGRKEIDIIAVKPDSKGSISDHVHVEVQVSVDPIGMLRPKNTLKSEGASPEARADAYIERKYLDPEIIKAAQTVLGIPQYRRVFVHGRLMAKQQLGQFAKRQIECIPIGHLVAKAGKSRPTVSLRRMIGVVDLLQITEV